MGNLYSNTILFSGSGVSKEELKKYQNQIDDLKKKLDEEKDKLDEIKSRGSNQVDFEELRKAQTEKHRLQKDVSLKIIP